MVDCVKPRLGYDDSLDAFGVHGAGGTLGALLTGVFAWRWSTRCFMTRKATRCLWGCSTEMRRQILNQLAGVAISWGLAIVGTLVILKVTDLLVGVRVSSEHEFRAGPVAAWRSRIRFSSRSGGCGVILRDRQRRKLNDAD